MKKIFFLLIIIAGCTPVAKDVHETAEKEIRETDIAMSDLAAKAGFYRALLAYGDSSLIKPQENTLPIVGKAALAASYSGNEGSKQISWAPFKVVAAASGDIGYSLGNWKFIREDTTLYGFYYTMWKKQRNGEWKWTVDGGNNMPGEFKM